MAWVVICDERIRRLLRLCWTTFYACVCASQWPGRLWMEPSEMWQLLTTPRSPAESGFGQLIVFFQNSFFRGTEG
jgi:hypothetical protein